MARIVPADLTRLSRSGAHGPEIETLSLLQQALPDAYTVFHGVHWTRHYKGRTVYGEIDFIVLDPAGRVLCIEQKNGPLEESDGGLVKTYGETRKDVGRQLMRSVDGIREKFALQAPREPPLEIEYLVYCPDYALRRLSAPALDAARIVDAARREQLPALIQTILPSGPAGRPERVERVERVQAFFRDTFEVVPDIHAHLSAQEHTYTRLSHGLVETLDNLVMEPLRLRVLATAGNGKTLVARHFYDRCVAVGGRPLLLCFNRPLAERLKHLVARGGRVATWYGFLDDFLRAHGEPLDFSTMQADPELWRNAARRVEEIALAGPLPPAWRFDTLILDEAQDFEADWFETLRLFLRQDADILWLEDPHQNVRGLPAAPASQGFVGYRSLLNYRSPERIARVIGTVLPELPFLCGNDLPGLGVGVSTYREPAEQARLVGRLVARLLSQRFPASEIAVLSCRGLESTALKTTERVGNHRLARFTGRYDLFGNQIWSDGQILFDSVRRFKGQQAAAVILTDVGPNPERLEQELSVLFCGMTRATVRLDLVADAGNAWVAERLMPLGLG